MPSESVEWLKFWCWDDVRRLVVTVGIEGPDVVCDAPGQPVQMLNLWSMQADYCDGTVHTTTVRVRVALRVISLGQAGIHYDDGDY